MASYTNIFGGSPVQTATDSYLSINPLNANITLSWPTQFQDTNLVVYKIMDVTPSAGGLSITLPDATQVSVGTDFLIVNKGVNNFNLNKNDGSLLAAVAGGNAIYFYLTNNTTAAGVWTAVPFGGGVATVLSVAGLVPLASDVANLTINGGGNTDALTGAVSLIFALAGDLAALTRFGAGVGIAVRTGANTWSLRQVQPVLNGNILVTNPDGVVGNILLDLQPNIGIPPSSAIASMQVGNIVLSANTISTFNLNGNLVLAPNGTGQITSASNYVASNGALIIFSNNDNTNTVSLSASSIPSGGGGYSLAFTWPAVIPTAGQVLQYSGVPEGALSWVNVTTFFGPPSVDKHIARFNGVAGQIQNSGITLTDTNDLQAVATITTTGAVTIGSLILGPTNIISSSANPIIISPAGGQVSQIKSDLIIGSNTLSNALRFQSTNFFVSLTTPALGGNVSFTLPAALPGPATQLMQGTNTGVLGFSALQAIAAVKLDMQAATDITLPVVPGVVQYHPGVVKAKANFTTVVGPVLSDAYNVNTVTRSGVGVYVVTFAIPFATANYTVCVTAEGVGAFSVSYSARATNNVQINIYASVGGAAADPTAVSFSALGTQ